GSGAQKAANAWAPPGSCSPQDAPRRQVRPSGLRGARGPDLQRGPDHPQTRSVRFLQEQHAEMLARLHQEIDSLKRENKDLHYKLIMNQTLQKGKLHFCVSHRTATSPIPSLSSQIRSGHSQVPASSSNPYLVNVLPSYIQKPPTLEECEIVIRQLWSINHMQAQEVRLSQLSPNIIISTSMFQFRNQEITRLPKVSLKDKAKKCLIVAPLPPAERAVLPALKQTLGNRFAERQKKTQAIQKNRLHRTLL
uniref:Coiled-coil domain-containing protein 74A-like n=1 Tax=Crocodylus porosus TaxID=8502 RepID=A0A7M4E114_CROPO